MKTIFTFQFFFLIALAFSQNEIENLGKNVNSEYDELKPVISADGNIIFYIVADHPRNTKQGEKGKSQDIWYTIKDENGNWGKAIHGEYPLNQTQNGAVIWVSSDGNRIMIKGYYEEGKYKHKGVSICTKTKYGWTEPQGIFIKKYKEMNVGKNSNDFMTNDGRYLLLSFCETKEGTINSLYFCSREEDGTWSQPKSLGKMFDDQQYTYMSPFMAADGVTLYFSSNRPGGLGGNDIWMTKKLDDSWQKWSEPVNLGAPINTLKWDAYFTLDATGEYAYLASSDKSFGLSDLVRVKMKEAEKPNPVVIVYGNVFNAKTKEPISADLIYEILPENLNAGIATSNAGDGSYKIVLPYGNNYSFRAHSKNFISVSENMDLSKVESYKEIKRDLYLVPIEKGQTIRLNNIFFDFAKSTLRPESFPELDRLVLILKENASIKIEMSGHTDNVGNDASNQKLSEERAKAVTEYLVGKGIEAKRITTKGYGKSKPVSANDTEEGRQMNRRVEFTIL